MALASAAGSDLIASLPAGGKMIFWAASWVCTWSVTKLCPQSSNPPATARTTARTSPPMTASRSKVLRRILNASLVWEPGPVGPGPSAKKILALMGNGGQGPGSPAGGTSVTASEATSPATDGGDGPAGETTPTRDEAVRDEAGDEADG